MKNQTEKSARRLRNDILLIAVLLVAAAIGATYLFVFRGGGNTVQVTVDGQLYGTYPLSQTCTVDIESGEHGDGSNRLIIRDGKAFMETADCPDGICVAHRPIFRDGESIVCLPNRVVVTVIVHEDTDAPDVVV